MPNSRHPGGIRRAAEAGGGARMARVRRPAGVASRRRTRSIRAPTDRSSRPRPRELLIALPSACASRDHRDDCGLSSRHPAAPIGFQPDPGYRRFSSCRGFRFGVQEGPGLSWSGGLRSPPAGPRRSATAHHEDRSSRALPWAVRAETSSGLYSCQRIIFHQSMEHTPNLLQRRPLLVRG